ncbi:hypothetical protein OE903_08050 [Bacillus sp. B6(2022)]|nr:hypothetical protein [Bacillus sp. B6(2022)]
MKDILTPLLVAFVVGGIVYVIDDRPIHPFLLFSSYLLAFIQSIESFILLRIISMSRKNNRRLCYTHEKGLSIEESPFSM